MTPEQQKTLRSMLWGLASTLHSDSAEAIGKVLNFVFTLTTVPPFRHELPTKCGDYRWKIDGVVSLALVTWSDHRPGKFAAWLPGNATEYVLEDMGGQWSGPLLEPPSVSALDVLDHSPGKRLFKTSEEVDDHVKRERDSWVDGPLTRPKEE